MEIKKATEAVTEVIQVNTTDKIQSCQDNAGNQILQTSSGRVPPGTSRRAMLTQKGNRTAATHATHRHRPTRTEIDALQFGELSSQQSFQYKN